ncbi:MAG: serine hydrolase [Bacteroidetes bacterium]|nr:serine hydrolase [Bacteroidota bacterium]
MKPRLYYILVITFSVSLSCSSSKKTSKTLEQLQKSDTTIQMNPVITAKTDSFLNNLLAAYPQYFEQALLHAKQLKVQIIYTQIDRDENNKPSFHDYYFKVDTNDYFYPASSVKMPIAFLALQKLNELKLPGLNKRSSFITEKDYSGQTVTYNDPSAKDGRPTIAQYIKKIFLVSNNDAFNRLYEFLGQEYINERLHKMGYRDVQILHRLSVSLTEDENRHTNPVAFYDSSTNMLYQQPVQFSQIKFSGRNDSVGEKYYDGNNHLIDHAMDFSSKNRISLEDLHHILRSVIFPQSVPKYQRFNLTDDDYRFLYQYMSQYPPETTYPFYDSATTWDGISKFLFWGAEKGSLPKNIRIFNKIGGAYGFLSDISYFVDFNKKIEFMLSAAIYCNSDGILNDDKYDYDSVGYPFMKNLGRVIYDYELKRKREHEPDLSAFKISYDR